MIRVLSLLASILCTFALCAEPIITSLDPNFGPIAGGNNITIVGSGFTGATAVQFGTEPATSFVVVNDSTIQAVAPIQVPSVVQIVVTANATNSSETYLSRYTYQGDSFAYVTDYGTSNLLVIDVLTDTVVDSIFTALPLNPAITPDGKNALVTLSGAGSLGVFDLANNTLATSIPITSLYTAITPDGTKAYVTSLSNYITQVDLNNYNTTSIPLGNGTFGIAVTPNGQKIYVSNNSSSDVSVLEVATNTVINTISVGLFPREMAITPDGSRLYVSNQNSANVSVIDLANDTVIATVPAGALPRNIAITPNGTKAYVANQFSNNLTVIAVLDNTVITTIAVGSQPQGVFITPDGEKGYVANGGGAGDVTVFEVETDTVIATITTDSATGVVVAPDQAPAAFFTHTLNSPTEVDFDASNSRSPVGQIDRYDWDFGDGQTETTANPLISHTYSQVANYTVTLTVTNSAGTSTTQVFTGQTMSLQGGASAVNSQTIALPLQPPTNFKGIVVKNKFATQTEYVHQLTWTRSPDARVSEYQIYRNGKLIGTVSANSPSIFNDHDRKKNKKDQYTIIAVSTNGLESTPISIIVP